ncbi:unnamed protein product [Closterium sp. NIES-53]
MAAQELRWLTYLLTDLGEQRRSPPVLYVDNKAMLALCREHRLEHRTKHIALRYFLARELQQRGQLRLAYVASEANTAHIFTKALAPGDHQRFCTLLACFALLDWSCDPLFSPTLPMGPELEELRSQIDAVFEKGFIRASTSPFAAPILFTSKKDGGLCMCIDYRALNRVTIKSHYPIPRTDDLLDQLRRARYFSKIDLRDGYHQIRVFADDYHTTAFRTCYGSYEFTVMPFSLTNAPSTFQLTMNRVFRDLPDRCVIVYLGDILSFSETREQHLRDLDAVFKRLQENRLITKGSKCEFFKQELGFLGYIISRDSTKIDPAKIKTVQEWKSPTNDTELQIFLGFVNYVQWFILNMAGITGPLTDLLHKDRNFVWGEEAEAAFQELKHFLVSPPVLRIANPSRPFEVVTDASDFAIGVVLLQDFGNGLQPIAYESRKLQAAERNYPIHDKEMLAIIHTFKLWRCYLVGADVTVRRDHKSLQYLRAQPNLNRRQIRWLDNMESHFTYRITYKKGANNIADALTRPTVQSAAVLIHHSNPFLTGTQRTRSSRPEIISKP